MEKTKNVLIVVLIILVLALGGMLIYSNVNINNNDEAVNNNNEQDNANIYGDIKQLYPTLLEVSTTECSQYISSSPEELERYSFWIDGGLDLFFEEDEENKFKKIPKNIKEALEYFGLLDFSGALGGGFDIYSATSELRENSNTFLADNLRIDKFNKVWSEGVKGNGIGEKIKYKYMLLRSPYLEDENGIYVYERYDSRYGHDPITIDELCDIQYNYLKNPISNFDLYDDINNCYFSTSEIIIENGYCKTKELWEKNGRVKTLKVTFEDGEEYILNLQDTMKPQSFKLEHKTNGIEKPLEATFEILDVYEGTTYQDTCITTLELKCDGYGISIGY